MGKKITFVTTNEGKIDFAKQYFMDQNILLEPYAHELIEPRTDDIKEIAKIKVQQAYEIVKQPCIALDSGFFIAALNGFPRAFVNFALDTLGIEGILKIMEGVQNRNCYFREVLAYYDGQNIEYFVSEHKGILSEQIRGADNPQKWSDLWYIFVSDYSEDGRTLAEYSVQEIDKIREQNDSSIKLFATWYSSQI